MGRKVKHLEMKWGNELKIDVSNLSPGVYFIKMGDSSSNTYRSAKIIVK